MNYTQCEPQLQWLKNNKSQSQWEVDNFGEDAIVVTKITLNFIACVHLELIRFDLGFNSRIHDGDCHVYRLTNKGKQLLAEYDARPVYEIMSIDDRHFIYNNRSHKFGVWDSWGDDLVPTRWVRGISGATETEHYPLAEQRRDYCNEPMNEVS